MSKLDDFVIRKLGFASDIEGTNFASHVGFSLALPLAGLALFGPIGMYAAGGVWMAWAVVNEFLLHGPTGAREMQQDLLSRLAPSLVVMTSYWLGHG